MFFLFKNDIENPLMYIGHFIWTYKCWSINKYNSSVQTQIVV